jgi:hypothetical protein
MHSTEMCGNQRHNSKGILIQETVERTEGRRGAKITSSQVLDSWGSLNLSFRREEADEEGNRKINTRTSGHSTLLPRMGM